MAKEIKLTFDGVEYTVPALNLGQLEEVMDIFEGQKSRIPLGVLRIAFQRATPKVDDVKSLEGTTDELGAAVRAILEAAGLQKADANPPVALTVVKND